MEAKKQKTDASPREVVRLPEAVEASINRVSVERQTAPLDINARKLLREIGEPASLKILDNIRSGTTPIKTFSGFVVYLVKKDYPLLATAVLSPKKSPSPNISLQSPLSNLQRADLQNISGQLSFEDETQEGRSYLVRDASSLSREHRKRAEPMSISPQLLILSKLEYRKLFLLLTYVGRKKLEDVLTVDDANGVYDMKDSRMDIFETEIWSKYHHKFCKEADRIQYLDWDSGKTHIYYCNVSSDGSYVFKGPYLNSQITHLQRSLGDDNVLIVKFLAGGSYSADKVVEEGIFVGLRRFRFFVFKDERKKVKKNQVGKDKNSTYSDVKCYFVHFDSISSHDDTGKYILSRKSVSEARRLFMHIHTLTTIEKYMARFSLILSKTTTLNLDFAATIVEIIKDIPFQDENGCIIHDEDGKPILHTDGTGFISEDLAMKYITDSSFQLATFGDTVRHERPAAANEPPLLIQCRLFHDGYAVKGTLLVNRKLEPGRIQIRPSMIKVEKDQILQSEETFNSLEIVTTSRRPGRNYFSKNLIALLSYGGVPQEFFLNLLSNALEETRNVYSNWHVALRVASFNDGLEWGFAARRMICSGVPLNEPYLQLCLSVLEKSEKNKLKEGKISVSESFYLMGTADPTGVLNNDQVCVILDSGQISGKVLVYRNPGLHFGDVHVMQAVYIKELEDFVGNAKYGIFFSTKGQKSAAYEMSTGDFDGDMYWVSRNPELLRTFNAHDPWRRVYSVAGAAVKRNPQKLSNLELELFQLFLEARTPSWSMSTAADSWVTYMDRLLTLGDDRATEKYSLKTKMLKLIDIYYDALDAPKSGKKVNVPEDLKAEMFPHYMGKGTDISYHSDSVLGKIYDRVEVFQNEAAPTQEIWKLPCFDISISDEHVKRWEGFYTSYRREMMEVLNISDESKNDAADDVIKKYKKILYEAPDMEESAKDTQVIYEEALAIYHVTYNYAIANDRVRYCGFAWKVAGSALCNLCAWKLADPKEKPLIILPSFLLDLLN